MTPRVCRTAGQPSQGTGRSACSRYAAATRLVHCGLASGQRDRLQVRDALEVPEVAAQDLAAPDRSVGPEARAVEDDGERRFRLAVLC